MISPLAVLTLMLIGLVMTFPYAIFESRHQRQKGEPLGSQRIALMSLAFTGCMLSLAASGVPFVTPR